LSEWDQGRLRRRTSEPARLFFGTPPDDCVWSERWRLLIFVFQRNGVERKTEGAPMRPAVSPQTWPVGGVGRACHG
jgi:hypothetical protein